MSTAINDEQKNELLKRIAQIEPSDTISQFMEKCNNNFSTISELGGGQTGKEGSKGSQGVPTKPKVPIHVWREGIEYKEENEKKDGDGYEISDSNLVEDLTNVKYQEGHLILLENAHVYILKVNDNNVLIPEFFAQMNSYDPHRDEKKAYVHFSYKNKNEIENHNINNKEYIGICSNNSENAPTDLNAYTWTKINYEEKEIKLNSLNLDDIQNSDLSKKLFSKQVTSSAGFIVDSLNTEPENNKNKIIIGGNNIKIINDDGNTSTLITSDDITDGEFDDTKSYESNEINTIYADVSLSSLSSNELQLISPYEEIDKNLQLNIINGRISIINSNNTISSINDGDIDIKIEYFIESENKWKEHYFEIYDKINYEWDGSNYIIFNLEINDDVLNEYRIRFKTIIKNIEYAGEDKNVDILLTTNYTYSIYNTEYYNNNNTTKIGKNGIIVRLNNEENDNKSEFHVSKDEIFMKVGKYGLKITNEGIFKIIDGVEESLLS